MFKNLIVLGVNASERKPFFSIMHNGKTVTLVTLKRKKFASQLVPLLCKSLKINRFVWSDIDRLCVTIGPGSFTGIRVALATVLGFNLGLKIPVVGVSIFDLWRWCFNQINLEDSTVLIVLSSGGRKDIYGALFKPKKNGYLQMGVWSKAILIEKTKFFNHLYVIGNACSFAKKALKGKSFFCISLHFDFETLNSWGSSLTKKKFISKSLELLQPLYIQSPNVKLKL